MDTTGWPGSSTPRTRVRIGLVLAVIGIMVVVPTAVWASHAFSDVPDTDWAHDEIAWLAEKELTHGCEDGTMFCPDDFVSRRELAVITHREHQNLDVRHEPVNKAVVLAAGIDARVATVEITLIENAGNVRPFDVTLSNLSDGQPFSPAVVATHAPSLALQIPGTPASAPIEAIAEDGDQSAAVARLADKRRVTDVVDVGAPLTPAGTTVGDFADEVSFEITGRPGDQLSLAAMLICTNDGLVLGDRLPLPVSGSVTYYLFGWDAGTEANTEASTDIVDPCSLLGPVALDGDPNGNTNAGIDTNGAVLPHPGIEGSADLLLAHGWDEPVAMLTISTK